MSNLKDFANLDLTREKRTGFPELVYAEHKTPKQLVEIFKELHLKQKGDFPIIATRVLEKHYTAVKKIFKNVKYYKEAKILSLLPDKVKSNSPLFASSKKRKSSKNKSLAGIEVAILSAGTSDLPVAEEARVLLNLYGVKTKKYYDVGIAGLDRLIKSLPKIRKAKVVICIAGMEGALPSVLSGLIKAPVISVPTSVGYGASYKGISALLTMINSCSLGVSVVNIDNGIGAAHFALRIINQFK